MAGGAYIIIALFFGLAGGFVGRLKGSSFLIWFLISGLIPVVGLLTALAYRMERDEPVRPCPRCGKVVLLADALCTRCGQELAWVEADERLPLER
ncbi:MAG TPA: hypothetical protein VGV40_03325 [Solirubrobacteraceae bacterium]|nr:hypothetical protein [Solirubrobacteraceae bacterium]